jgi:hypothetical protein
VSYIYRHSRYLVSLRLCVFFLLTLSSLTSNSFLELSLKMPGISERKKKMAVLYSFCLYSNPFCLVLSTDDDSCHAGWVTSNVGYSPRDRRGSSRHRSKAVSFLFGNFLSSIIGRRMSEIQSPISSSPSEIPPLIFSCPFANPGHIIFSFTLHSSWVFLRDALKV